MDKGVIDVQPCHKSQYHISPQYVDYIDSILIPEGQIDSRFQKIAYDIANHYCSRPFVVLVILKGSVFIAELLKKHLRNISQYNSDFKMPQFHYLRCKSYSNDQSTGTVQINDGEQYEQELKGKEVLIVEDIIDTGKTLKKLIEKMQQIGVKSVKCCVLIKKMEVECVYEEEVEFLGFRGPNMFYIGAGMDYNEQFREMGHLAIINQKGIEQFKQ